MRTIHLSDPKEEKVITLKELLKWKTVMLDTEKSFLKQATKTSDSKLKEYNIFNANTVRGQLSFLERLINQASEKGEQL